MKKILGLLLAICLIGQTIMPFSVIADENINIDEEVVASSATSLQKGEYLYFGNYNGSPVKYIVAGKQDVNGDGKDEILIITDKIIMRKNYSVDNYAIWSESTLRTYLNSNDKEVNYPEGKAPDADWISNVVANLADDYKNDQYAWDNEAGFLTNLSDFERNQIVPVTHKSIVHKDDLTHLGEGNWGGTESHAWYSGTSSVWHGVWSTSADKWPHAYTNYDGGTDKNGDEHGEAYHQLTKDYCFIPSIKDIHDFGINIALPGNNLNTAYSNGASAYSIGTGAYTWTRDASGPDGSPKKMFAKYYGGGDMRSTHNNNFLQGVRPMFFIKSDIPLSGLGTEASPYVINEPYKLSATINGEATATTIPSGENVIAFTVTSASVNGVVANIAVLKIENGVETVKYLDSKALTTNTDSFTVEVDDADYIKLFLTDTDGKDLRCAPVVIGKETRENLSAATASVNTIFVDEPSVSDGVVTITGATGAERFSYVNIEFKKDTNGGVAYKNQIIADENGAFSVNFKVSELFGVAESEKNKIGGWYTLTVSSSEATSATKRVGVSDESILLDVIDIFNNKDVEKIGKILANDENYILEYSALPKNDMILADVAAENISSLAQYIADTIPEEGYTKDTFASVFNKSAAAFLLINEEDIAKKYKFLEDKKYKGILGSEEFTNKSYYKELKEAKSDVFALLSVEAVDDIIENAIMYLANNAESPEDLMEIVELESDAIGVELDSDYDKIKNYADILQDMYFNMMTTFDDYDDIVSAFNSAKATALTKVAEKQNQIVSNNTSSNKGSSSSGRVIKITKPQVTEDKEEVKEDVVITPSKKAPFTDIDDLSYGIDAINRLYQDGVISGDGDGLFRPYDTVKREEFTKMLSAAFDIISDTEIAFSDVKEDMWYHAYIKNLYGAGIIKGTSETTFGIGENLTRQDLAVMLYRFLNEESKANEATKYDDDVSISEYAKEAVYALNHIGIINGFEDNTFKPLKLATRQETAQLIWKVKNYIEYGNQEAFSVENQNKKPEHYDFLESLGIKFDTEKNFDDSISKSEFVYLIMKAVNIGDITYSDAELIFRDVKADFWAYNEITAAAKLGIVKGYVDDAFGINDFVASNDAAIMAMRAIGFSSALTEAELIANFSTIYNDILEGVNNNSQITLADAYTLIFNMLNSKYPSDDVIGTDEIVLSIQKDSIFMEKAFDIYKYTGRVEANQFSSVGIATKVLGKNQVQIDGFVYSCEVDTADFIGLSVEYFIKAEGSQEKIIYMVSYEDALDQITIQDAFLTDVQKDGNEIIVYYENAANKEKTERFPLNAAIIYNGSATSFKIGYIKELIDGGRCGSVTIIDDNGNYIVRIDSYKTEIVKTISTYDSKIIFESGNEIDFEDDDFLKYISVSRNGEKCEILDLVKDDVALVKESIDGNVVIIEADNWAIDGTVTGYSDEDDFIEINNAQYVMSNNFAKNTTLTLGEKAKFYFDIFGNVAYMDNESVVYDEQYGFLVNIASLLDLGKGHTMSVYTLDGEIKTYELLEEVKFNSSTTKKKAEDLAKDFDDGKIPNQMVYFKQSSDGFITTIGTAQTGSNILSLDISSAKRRYLTPFFANGTAETDIPLFYVDADTMMIMAPATDADQSDFEDEKNYETSTARGYFKDYQQYVVEAYNLNDFNVAKFVVLRDEALSDDEPSGTTQMVVTNTVVMVDEEGEMQNVIKGVTGKGEVTLVLKEDELGLYTDANGDTKAIKRGDIIKYALNNKGICNYTKYTGSIDSIDRTGSYSGKTNSDKFLASGTVIDSEGTYLKISFGDGTETVLYGLTNMTPIICDSKNDRIFAGTLSDIQSGDFVYTRSRYSYLQEIIVVK